MVFHFRTRDCCTSFFCGDHDGVYLLSLLAQSHWTSQCRTFLLHESNLSDTRNFAYRYPSDGAVWGGGRH